MIHYGPAKSYKVNHWDNQEGPQENLLYSSKTSLKNIRLNLFPFIKYEIIIVIVITMYSPTFETNDALDVYLL